MTNSILATYLNDHLAGSVAALELLESICSAKDQMVGNPSAFATSFALSADDSEFR